MFAFYCWIPVAKTCICRAYIVRRFVYTFDNPFFTFEMIINELESMLHCGKVRRISLLRTLWRSFDLLVFLCYFVCICGFICVLMLSFNLHRLCTTSFKIINPRISYSKTINFWHALILYFKEDEHRIEYIYTLK